MAPGCKTLSAQARRSGSFSTILHRQGEHQGAVTALPTARRGWCGGRWACSSAVAPDSAALEAAPGGLGGPGERTGLRWGAACSPATAGFPGVMPGLALQEEQGHTCALWGLVSSEGRSGVLGPSADRCFRCKTPLS